MTHQHEPEINEELRQGLTWFFQKIPFNNLIGMEICHLCSERVEIKVPMKPELIGNFIHNNLHGGVISSVLDVAGGCMAVVGAYLRTHGMDDEARQAVLSKVGTIDLRVDYLRPGRGEFFIASARLLRAGNKVAVTRMSFHSDSDELLAVGSGTYLCG